jgi:hypothetical protein
MIQLLLEQAHKELQSHIEDGGVTFELATELITKIAKKYVPSDPTEILKIIADDYRFLTYDPCTDLSNVDNITPLMVIQILIQESIEEYLWDGIEHSLEAEDDVGL